MTTHSKRPVPICCLTICFMALPVLAAETQPSTESAPTSFDIAEILTDPPASQPGIQRGDALQKAIEGAVTPLDQATAHLAMANWLLATPTARPATRLILGYPTPEDITKFAEAARSAQTHLETARTLLKPEAPEAKERRRTLRLAATTLEAFANLFAAIGSGPSNGSCIPCSEAALELAAAREAEDPEIAAAALLWQSLGWELSGRRERALISLPNALETPEHLPYDFMSRLLRCRLLAEGSPKAAAVALTIRIRALGEKWFPRQTAESNQEKRRLADILQYQFLREWISEVESGEEAAVQKLQTMLDQTKETLLGDQGAPAVYFLEASIPLIVEPPKPNTRLTTLPAATAPAEDERNTTSENISTNPASE